MEKKEKSRTCKNCGNNETKAGCGSCTCSKDDPNNPSGWKPVRPRICEVLGVEETPVSKAMEVVIDALREDKTPGSWYYSWRSNIACTIMDHADVAPNTANEIAIKFLDHLCERKPRFTQEEVEDARVLARALLANGFERDNEGDVFATSSVACRTLLDSNMFPSLRPGQAVELEEIVG